MWAARNNAVSQRAARAIFYTALELIICLFIATKFLPPASWQLPLILLLVGALMSSKLVWNGDLQVTWQHYVLWTIDYAVMPLVAVALLLPLCAFPMQQCAAVLQQQQVHIIPVVLISVLLGVTCFTLATPFVPKVWPPLHRQEWQATGQATVTFRFMAVRPWWMLVIHLAGVLVISVCALLVPVKTPVWILTIASSGSFVALCYYVIYERLPLVTLNSSPNRLTDRDSEINEQG